MDEIANIIVTVVFSFIAFVLGFAVGATTNAVVTKVPAVTVQTDPDGKRTVQVNDYPVTREDAERVRRMWELALKEMDKQ